MGQTQQTPGGETLWQRELQGHRTIRRRRELGIEEGGLVQVLTHLYRRLFLWGLHRGVNRLIGFYHSLFLSNLHRCCHGHSLIHHHTCGLHTHMRTHHRPTGEIITTVRGGIDILIKLTEQE